MNPIRKPRPQPEPRRTPRHQAGRRGGRPAIDLLAAHSLRPGTCEAWTASGRHAVATEEPRHLIDSAAAAAALDLDLAELDNLDVFAAASIVRRRAHTATHRLYRCRPQLRRARRATGIALDGGLDSAAIIPAVTERVLAVQIGETRLVAALDKLESITNRAHAARSARALFYPHGGRLVISRPMHERLAQRQELADNTAAALQIIASRALHNLLRHTAAAERFVTSLEQHIDHVLDQAAAAAAAAIGNAPPAILRLLRATLPARRRHEWWRETCSLFAEATPTERRAARLNLLANTPRILWISWALNRYQHHASPTDAASHPPKPSESPAGPHTDRDPNL